MLPEWPVMTVWLEFASIELARLFYRGTQYPCRLSPACDRSVDITLPGWGVPTAKLRYIPGVVKRPEMFILDTRDPLPFREVQDRMTARPVAA